jgi:hypothetical protein
MVGVAFARLILLASQLLTDDVVVLFYHSLAVFVVGFVVLNSRCSITLFTFFFERLVNKRPSKNRIFVPSDGVAEGRLGYTTMTALLEDVGS